MPVLEQILRICAEKVIKQIEPYINPSGRKLIRYKCRCSCGVYKDELANVLRAGDVTSCGCKVNSKGERIVSQWLIEHGYTFELHKSFDDCLSDKGYKLNFDFYVPSVNALIECNGIQHYKSIDFFGGYDRFEEQQRHDKIKRNYAFEHGFRYIALDCRKNKLKYINDKLYNFFNKR